MRLIKRDNETVVFHLGRREKGLLVQLLQLYPQVPSNHPRACKSGKIKPSTEQLLKEALNEHRTEQKKQISGLLNDASRWTEHHQGWHLRLNSAEVEWLLQILNDIRVGSWVQLGAPEESIEVIDEKNAPHLWAMEIAGSFEMALLHTLEAPPQPPK